MRKLYILIMSQNTMITKVRESLKNATPTKYNRIKNYMQLLEDNVEITSKRDQKNVEDIKDLSQKLIKKVKVYYRVNMVLYFAIYFSFISFFIPDVLILSEIGQLVSTVLSVVGTAIFIIAVFFSQKIVDLYYQDLNLLASHLIAIYTKHQKEYIEDIMDDKKNVYEKFIEYFRDRYKIKN